MNPTAGGGLATASQQLSVGPLAVKFSSSGKLLRFLRHPRHAALIARVAYMELQAATRFVLEVLLSMADREGVTWVQATEIANLTPRSTKVRQYSLASILRGLRILRTMGLIDWHRISPFGHYPPHPKTGKRRACLHGGRVWRVDIERLEQLAGVPPLTKPKPRTPVSSAGTSLAGSITYDRSGSITSDRSTDRVVASQQTDPARAEALAPALPSVAQVASETPSAPVATSPARSGDRSANDRERTREKEQNSGPTDVDALVDRPYARRVTEQKTLPLPPFLEHADEVYRRSWRARRDKG